MAIPRPYLMTLRKQAVQMKKQQLEKQIQSASGNEKKVQELERN